MSAGYHKLHSLRHTGFDAVDQRAEEAYSERERSDIGPRRRFISRPRQPMTHSLQRSNALETDEPGYHVTLVRPARGLSIGFTNISDFAVYISPPRRAHQFEVQDDRIDDLPNSTPFVLEAGASVKFKCDVNGLWVSQ